MVTETSTTIDAEPDAVWEILADAPRYPSWDSGVLKLEGRIAPGEKLKVTSEVNPKRAYPVKVTQLEPGRRMVWTGGMPLGLFKGDRSYTLTPEGAGRTRFTMREEFSGPMLPIMKRVLPDMQPSFEHFARGLKQRAEGM